MNILLTCILSAALSSYGSIWVIVPTAFLLANFILPLVAHGVMVGLIRFARRQPRECKELSYYRTQSFSNSDPWLM